MGNLNRKVLKMWWDIKDVAFVGTNITRKNGMFMSAANVIPVGSVFDIRKRKIGGRLVDQNLVFSFKTLAENYSDYPKILADTAKPSTKFSLDSSTKTGVEVLTSLVDTTSIANIDAELSNIIKKARKIQVSINQWGTDYMEEGEISIFLLNKSAMPDDRIKQILDGDNYIATRGIWIKGISFQYDVDQETLTKVKTILETKRADLIKANIDLKVETNLQLNFDFKFEEKFYPFFKFRKIVMENKKDYYMLADKDLPEHDVFLDDVDFEEYTV